MMVAPPGLQHEQPGWELHWVQTGLQHEVTQLQMAAGQLIEYPGMQQAVEQQLPRLQQACSSLSAEAFGRLSSISSLNDPHMVDVLVSTKLLPALADIICVPFGLHEFQPSVKQKLEQSAQLLLGPASRAGTQQLGHSLLAAVVGQLASDLKPIATAAWELRFKERKVHSSGQPELRIDWTGL